MRHAAAILIASLTALVPLSAVPQETSPSPAVPAPSDVKVAGRDVPAPKRTHFVSPVFPPEAQAAGLRGIVILELLVDTAGKVASADVLRSVAPFDDAALVAVRQWEYEVTKVDGKPVPNLDAYDAVAKRPAGTSITMTIVRDGKNQALPLTLGTRFFQSAKAVSTCT